MTPPPPPFLARRQFSKAEGGIEILKPPAAGVQDAPALFIYPPVSRRVFGGGWGCISLVL